MTQADILHVFRNNVETIKKALVGGTSGYVYVWREHWLGVKFNNDVCHAVAVDRATVVRGNITSRSFTNGKGERAVAMPRGQALQGALVHAQSILESFEKAVAA